MTSNVAVKAEGKESSHVVEFVKLRAVDEPRNDAETSDRVIILSRPYHPLTSICIYMFLFLFRPIMILLKRC